MALNPPVPLSKPIGATALSVGNNTIVPAVAAKRIYAYHYSMTVNQPTVYQWFYGTEALTGPMPLDNGIVDRSDAWNPLWVPLTAVNQGLILALTVVPTEIGGYVSYVTDLP